MRSLHVPASSAASLRTLLTALTLLLVGTSPGLAATFDFVSSDGQFTIAGGSLDFGNGLTVSSATTSAGDPDAALANAIVLLDPIALTGATVALPGGLTAVEIDDTIDYGIEIYTRPEAGGELILSALYDPGDFLVIGASGMISPEIVNGISDVSLALFGYSEVLDELAITPLLIDFNVTLSAAGQDIGERVASGQLVAGSVAGSVATVIPEPGTAMLMALGLLGLASVPGRPTRRRAARID